MSSPVKNVEVDKISDAGTENKVDLVAVEEPLEIRLGYGSLGDRQQRSVSVTMRTPGNDFELALGFLFTENVIASIDQVESVKYCEDLGRQEEIENVVRVELRPEVKIEFDKLQRNFYTTSSCGVCGKTSIDAVKVNCGVLTSNHKIPAAVIHALTETVRKKQSVFEYTGGIHASALFDPSGMLLLLREDVGRHNALDKAIGAMLFKNSIPLSNVILVVSGRASFELVQKAAVAGIPILVAVGAPSSLAVKLAQDVNMTLLGFVRDNRFNIYAGKERILSV